MLLKTKTVKDLLLWAEKFINRLDAELLLSHITSSSREELFARPDKKVKTIKARNFQKLVKKRAEGVPAAYLTGHKEFYGLDFLVNKHTLIPRPDTELMIEEAIKRISNNTILIDVGTGSGCIPISIMKSLGNKKIKAFATDISRQALSVARKNTERHGLNIEFFQGNLLEPIINSKILNQKSKIIITANLPYLTQAQYDEEASIQHEPKSALVAKKGGLELYEKLLQQVSDKLTFVTPNISMALFLEIDPSQTQKISKIIKDIIPKAKFKIKKDLAGRDRLVVVEV